MKLSASICMGLVLALPVTLCAQQKADELVAWGVVTGNTRCMIFAERTASPGTTGKLTLIEAHGSNFDLKEVPETKESLDSLSQLAKKNQIKLVKIPEKHSPGLLDKARAACKSAPQ
jgi:hypothetical protein